MHGEKFRREEQFAGIDGVDRDIRERDERPLLEIPVDEVRNAAPDLQVDVVLAFDDSLPGVTLTATARTTGRTGVEMEAMTAVSVAALAVYDMIKGIDRRARISDVRLIEKHGGRSGDLVLEPGP